MNKLSVKIKSFYYATIQSIAFYPTLIALIFFLIALLAMYLETMGVSQYLKEKLPFVVIASVGTASSVVNTLMAGIISLTVFSFTMVMVVLNQASSNFSPRVIPGLITQKANQVVLGFYLGTIIYLLLISMNIQSEYYNFDVPRTAIFLGICFGLACLALFVYFINAISSSIQIGNIIRKIYRQTRQRLQKEIKDGNYTTENEMPNTYDWKVIGSPVSGYLHNIEQDDLLDWARKNNRKIQLLVPIGSFVVKDNPLMKIENNPDNNVPSKEQLFNACIFYHKEVVKQNYVHGFKQITEIAVKALSPGINDPGTAVNCIDYLTDLFALRMELFDHKLLSVQKRGEPKIYLTEATLDELMYFCLTAIREYGKSDAIVTLKLLNAIKSLMNADSKINYHGLLIKHAAIMVETAKNYIENSADRKKINELIEAINKCTHTKRYLHYLKSPVSPKQNMFKQ